MWRQFSENPSSFKGSIVIALKTFTVCLESCKPGRGTQPTVTLITKTNKILGITFYLTRLTVPACLMIEARV